MDRGGDSQQIRDHLAILLRITFQHALFGIGIKVECLQWQVSKQKRGPGGHFHDIHVRLRVQDMNSNRLIDRALDQAVARDHITLVQFVEVDRILFTECWLQNHGVWPGRRRDGRHAGARLSTCGT